MARNNGLAVTVLAITGLLVCWIMTENILAMKRAKTFSPTTDRSQRVQEPLQKQTIKPYNALYWRVADE
ncbi:MAG: hypothetical protein K8S27_11985 [Candidatus Omnitrophica bacterium]|nr:hypothetical protein [Candidatus Omnitrophota bacterium]